MGVLGLFKKNAESKSFAVWHRRLNTPVFDTKRQLRIYTNKNNFTLSYKKNAGDFWSIPYETMELKQIDDIESFYNTMWIHYGCKTVVIDDQKPETLQDKISIDFSHFNKNVPGHEVCNPELRMCIILFNMHSGNEQLQQPLLSEYLGLLKSAELLIPFNPQSSSLITSMDIGNSKKLIAFTSFEAISTDLRNQGYSSGIVQNIDDLIDTAIKENVEIAINVNSAGGGVILTYNDLFQIKGVMDVFNKAEEYRIAQQLDEAAPLYEQAANAGYRLAQNNLAVLLQNGTKSIPADIRKAIYWYEKAAETFAPSAFTLGRIYDVGNMVPQDLEKAAKYYLKAANLGHPQAMFNVGVMYVNGEGVTKNPQQGINWLQKAAQNGEPNAIAALQKLQ